VARGLWRVLALCVGLAPLPIACAAQAADAPAATLSASGLFDAWRNLQGGLGAGSAQLAEAEARLDVDGGRLLSWRGGTASVSILQTALNGPSTSLLGDLQAADNKEATPGVRLYEAWLRQALPGGYVKTGVIDMNSEFNVSAVSSIFINGAQGLGLDLGQVGTNGPSVYPDPRLGLVTAAEGAFGVKLAVFDGLTQAGGPQRREGPLASHGALAIFEVARRTAGGAQVSAAVWRHSANFGGVLQPVRAHPASGGYVMIEAPLWHGGARALSGMFRLGAADAKTEQIALHLTADLVLERPFLGPDGEILGLGVVSAAIGDHARLRASLNRAPLEDAETVVEFTYRRPVSPRFFIQPDVQYIVHPGAARRRPDALLTGVRLGFAWSSAR